MTKITFNLMRKLVELAMRYNVEKWTRANMLQLQLSSSLLLLLTQKTMEKLITQKKSQEK